MLRFLSKWGFPGWSASFSQKMRLPEVKCPFSQKMSGGLQLPELSAFYGEICDFRTAGDIGIDRPEKREILHHIPPTPEHKRRSSVS